MDSFYLVDVLIEINSVKKTVFANLHRFMRRLGREEEVVLLSKKKESFKIYFYYLVTIFK
jgi:hypothetical protein